MLAKILFVIICHLQIALFEAVVVDVVLGYNTVTSALAKLFFVCFCICLFVCSSCAFVGYPVVGNCGGICQSVPLGAFALNLLAASQRLFVQSIGQGLSFFQHVFVLSRLGTFFLYHCCCPMTQQLIKTLLFRW